MANPNNSTTTTQPQDSFKNDQDIINLDISSLFQSYMVPIDQHRITDSGNYIESRCGSYYRIVGFPVAEPGGSFYSPGFDPNLNTDSSGRATNLGIDQKLLNNRQIISQQLEPREQIFKTYQQMFATSGFNATAIVLGSQFVRAFDRQFSDGLGPFDFDPRQSQEVGDRYSFLYNFYNKNDTQSTSFNQLKQTGLLTSTHLLKPFIVYPKFSSNINNINKAITAPFLLDPSQLNVFPAGGDEIGKIKSPFIEQVISIRFYNTNATISQNVELNNIIDDIKNDPNNLDQDQLKLATNPANQLQNSDFVVFNSYLRLLFSIVDQLVDAIKSLADTNILNTINFQPIPNLRGGIESGATLNDPVSNDPNNQSLENNILSLNISIVKESLAQQLNAGTSGIPNPSNFVFSNLGDTVFVPNKTQKKSFNDRLQALQNNRNQLGNNGIEALQTIEMIMGEFSGLGIIDVVAIQAAFWLMNPDDLLGLIDTRAFQRAQLRNDLDFSGSSPTQDITAVLTGYETALKNVYFLIQTYFNQSFTGEIFLAS